MHQKKQKLKNLRSILDLVRVNNKISQAQLAIKTRLQPSTVSNLVKVLKSQDFLIHDGKGTSGKAGGRKSDLLSINPDFGCFGGIYVRNTELIFNLIDYAGNIIERKTIPVEKDKESEIVEKICTEIHENRDKHPNYSGTGIAVSSIISESGDILVSPDFHWNIPEFISSIKADSPDLPLVVENDANCAAYYSYLYWKERYSSLISFLIFKEPFMIGLGIILKNEIYGGANGAAGEIWGYDADQVTLSGDDETIRENLEKVKRYILTSATLLDIRAITISGDILSLKGSLLDDFLCDLRRNAGRIEIKTIQEQDAPILGAALIASNLFINNLLTGD